MFKQLRCDQTADFQGFNQNVELTLGISASENEQLGIKLGDTVLFCHLLNLSYEAQMCYSRHKLILYLLCNLKSQTKSLTNLFKTVNFVVKRERDWTQNADSDRQNLTGRNDYKTKLGKTRK